jgi:dolichyl-phosphate beta-glucosyltransferase
LRAFCKELDKSPNGSEATGEKMHCAVVIPCFCESKRLPLFLESLCSELLGASFQTSVVVVDDGSGYPEDEGLRKVIDRFKNSYPDLIADPVFLKQNSGKGGAD